MKRHLLKNILAPIVALFVAFVALPQAAQAQTTEAYVVEKGSTLTFYYDANKATRTGTVYGIDNKLTGSETIPVWAGGDKNINTRITKVVFDDSFKDYKPTSTANWFYNCRTLETIDGIKNLSTYKVTTMLSMFENCYALKSLDLTRFDTSNVTNMNFMFCFCSSLSSLDLTNFDTSKVDDMDYLFYNCSNLTTIYCNDDWNTSTVAFSDYMFYGCTRLKGAVAFDSSKTDVEMANPTTGYFTKCMEAYAVEDGTTLTFYYDTNKATRTGTVYGINAKLTGSKSIPAWAGGYDFRNERITKVVFDSSFKGYKPTSTQDWFIYCSTLQTFEGFENLNTDQVTTMNGMFSSCLSLSSLDLSSFNTSNVTDMNGMFSTCSSLSSLDISSFDTSKVTDMFRMFNSCSSLSSLDLSNFDTSKVTDMSSMFSSCSSLSSLDLSSFDTSNVTKMYRMFYSCSSLSSLDLSYFDTSKVTDMSYMFKSCSSLSSLEISSFDTSKVTDMSYMFDSCSRLSSLDLSSFDTSKVTDMRYMFNDCANLTTIYCNDDWNRDVVLSSSFMFSGCTSLKGAVAYNEHKLGVMMANPTTGYFTKTDNLKAYVVENGSTLTFYYDTNKATRTGTVYDINAKHADNPNMPAWAGSDADKKVNITKVVFDNSFRLYNPTSMKYWFYNYTKINAIEGLSNLQTGKVTSMGYMFINCSSLTSLDLSSFNTKNVVNMASMFYSCSSLSSLDLSSFNTSKVTDMAYMFRGCSAIKMLNVSSFNTSKVTDMRFLFNNCANLTTIYCNDDWNTSTVQYCDSMFDGCTSLVGAVAYDASKTDVTMANPTTGYFTKKDGGVESLESEAVPAARRGIYNLQGVKMQGSFDQLPAGFYIVNGQKVFKK